MMRLNVLRFLLHSAHRDLPPRAWFARRRLGAVFLVPTPC